MRTPSEYLKDFVSCTEQSRSAFADDIIQDINNGNVDPLIVLSAIRNLKNIIELIDTSIKENVLNELSKYGKSIELYGMKLEQKEVGVKYNFDSTNDRVYSDLRNNLNVIDSEIKNREKWLKTIPNTGIDVITDDGEVFKIMPPIKTSTTSFSVTLK
jgi:hypothetical protein